MAKPHTPAEVKAFDTMKFWVAIILLLILLWQCSSNQSTADHGITPAAPHALTITTPSDQMPITSLSGTATGSSKVQITTPEGATLGMAEVDASSNWTLDNLNLDGVSAVIATAMDASGKAVAEPISLQLVANPFTVDTPDWTLPEITVSGLGTLGSKLRITDGNGKVLGEVTVDADGRWLLGAVQTEGLASITVAVLDDAQKELANPAPITVMIPEKGAPTLTLQTSTKLQAGQRAALSGRSTNASGKTIRIFADGLETSMAQVNDDGQWLADVQLPENAQNITARMLDGDTVVAESNVINVLEQAIYALTVPKNGYEYIKSYYKTITLWGKGKVGENLNVYQDGVLLGNVTVRSDGRWRLPIPTPEVGEHIFSVRRPSSTNDLGLTSRASVFAKPKR